MTLTKRIFTGAALILLTACHGYVARQSLPESCPHIYKSYDLALCWKTERSADRVTIAGYATNTRFSYITGLEVAATLLDEQGKPLGDATDFVIPTLLAMDYSAPFTLAIPVRSGDKPAKIRFFYLYHLSGLDDGQTPQFHSFVTDFR